MTEPDMLMWNGDPKLKAQYVEAAKTHRKADNYVKGSYGRSDGKGCAVGCTIKTMAKLTGELLDTSDHSLYERYIGPEWMARLEDTVFEGLPLDESKDWPVDFLEAIPVGRDGAWCDRVKWSFSLYLLAENRARVEKLDIPAPLKAQVISAIDGVAKVNRDALDSGTWDESAARSAVSAARSAAWSAESAASAARSAAWSAESAARSAESAAWSAESAARSAARSAASAESAAWSAASAAWSAESAESAAYTRYAKHFLKLLKTVK